MPPIFKTYKSLIDAFLLQFLESKKKTLDEVNEFGPDLIERIQKIVVAGKTIRGSLVLFSFCFTNKKPSEDALKVAAALELIQTALVIHDDIMDRDATRRGIPSLHVQYKSESLAMCAGDILFFLAFELLGSMQADKETLGRIIRLVGREFQSVGAAQMADVAKTAKSKLDILSLYTYKTARYTFAVPLMLGVTLAGTTKEMLKFLEAYGVSAGVIFQIRDDELDHEKTLGTKELQAYRTSAEEAVHRMPIKEKDKLLLRNLLNFVESRNL